MSKNLPNPYPFLLKLLVLLLPIGGTFSLSAQTISNITVSGTPVCAGATVSVSFDVTNGASPAYFDNATAFQLYLSNGTGTSFTPQGSTFNLAGPFSTTNGGVTNLTYNFTIPVATTTGAGYKIAIGSANPTFDGSTGANASIGFAVNEKVTPSVSIVSDAPGNTICEGAPITYTATPVNGGSSPLYQWRINGLNSGSQTSSNTFSPTGLSNGDIVSVVMQTNAVCATTSMATAGGITTTVKAVPAAPSAAVNSVCVGGTIDLTATPISGATYSWTGPGSFVSASQNPSIANATTSMNGTYHVTATINGCTSAQGNVNVTVKALPPTPTTGSNSPICAGSNINLTASPVSGATYAWTGPNGFSSTLRNPSVANATALNAGTYTVIATTNGSGCNSLPGTTDVAVTDLPTTPASTNNGPVCTGASINLSTATVAGAIYTWTGPNSFTSSNQNPVIANAGASNAGTYTVTVTASGCTSLPGSTTLTVNPVPATPTASNNGPICTGSNVTLSAAAVTGATYAWTGPGGYTSSIQNPVVSSAIAGNYTVTATIGTCASASSTTTVVVNSIPATPAPLNNGPVCVGSTINLSTPSVSGATYTWTGPSSFTSSQQNPTRSGATTVMAGVYNLTVTVNGCTSASGSTTVAVNTIPTIMGTTPNDICVSGTTTLSATASAGTVNWYAASTGGTSLATGPNFTTPTLSATTTYYVDATSNGCTTGSRTPVIATVNARPTITSAINNSFCAGNPVALNATPSAGTVRWYSAASGGTLLYTGTPYSPSPSATTTYYAEALLGTACTAASRVAVVATRQSGMPVTGNGANGKPTVSPNSSVCPPASGIVISKPSGMTTLTPDASSYYQWNLPAGFVITSGAGTSQITVSVTTAANPGSNSVTVNAITPCGNSGASGSLNISIANFASVDAGEDVLACSGTPITLTAMLLGNASNVASWQVLSGGGSISNIVVSGTTATATYTPSTTPGTATLKITPNTPSGACSGGVTASQNLVTINQPSTAPTSLLTSTATICNGGSVTLTQTGGTLGTGASWKWYSDNTYSTLVGTGSGANASLSVSPTATTTYYVRAESTTGTPCAANVVGPSTGVKVTVNQPSVAPSALNATISTICKGSSTTLTQTGGSLGTGATWKWYSDNSYTTLVGTSSNAGANLSVSPASTTTYYLRAESATGAPCTGTVAAAATVTVTVNEPSTAPSSVASTAAAVCNGDNITLTQMGGTLGTGAIWHWYRVGSSTELGTSTNADASFTISPTVSRTYWVRAESTSGSPCAANVGSSTISVDVTVYQPSVAPTGLTVTTATICKGSSTTLRQTGGSLGTGATWYWYSDPAFTSLVGSSTVSNAQLVVSPAANTTYYLRAQTSPANSCAPIVAAASSVDVVVNEPSVAPASLNATATTICNPGSTTLTQTGGVLGTGAVWKWYTASNYSSGSLVGTSSDADGMLVVSPVGTTTYYVRAESTTGAPCTANVSAAVNVPITVNQPVTITVDPQSKSVCSSFPVSFSVTASGTNPTYQWLKDGTPIADGGTISGSTTGTLSISQAYLPDAGTYSVVVSGAAPCGQVTSAGAVLTVNETIGIATQPVASTICQGENTTFSVAANGTIDSYVWRRNGVPVSGGVYSNETTGTLTITGATPASNGNFDVVISGPSGIGCSQAVSMKAALLVNPTPTVAANITSQTKCSGTAISNINFSGTVSGTTYNWTRDFTTAVTGIPASGAGNISGTLANTTSSPVTVTFTVTPTANGCPGTPIQVTVLVNPTPNVVASISSQPICSGDNISPILLTGDVAGTVFNWTRNSPAGISGISTGNGDISGSLSNSTNAPVTVTFTITPAANGCAGSSITSAVTINPIPSVTPTASAISLCSGANLTINLNGPVSGTTFIWTPTVTNLNSLPGGNTTSASFTQAPTTNTGSNGTVSYSIVPSANGCVGLAATVGPITVYPLPAATVSTSGNSTIAVCQNSGTTPVTFTGSNGTAPYTFTYQVSVNGAAFGANQTISTSAGSNTVDLNVPSTTAGTYAYKLVSVKDANTANCPQTVSGTATVTVKTLPQVNSVSTGTVCSGVAQNYAITSNTSGTTYSWSRAAVSGISNAAVSGQTASTIAETLTNTTTTAKSVVYSIVPTANGCAGSAFIYTVTVNPVTTVTLSSTSADQAFCNTTPMTAITYQVTGVGNGATVSGLPPGVTGSYSTTTKVLTISGTPNVTNGQTSFPYTVTATGTCGTATATGTLTVNPSAVGGATARTTGTPFVCANDNSGVVTLSGQSGNVVKWQKSLDNGATWTDITNTGTSQSFTNLPQTTTFRAVIATTACPTLLAYSTSTVVSVVPKTGSGSLSAYASPTVICSGSSTLTAIGFGADSTVGFLSGGDFDNAGTSLDGPGRWRKIVNGVVTNIEASTNNTENSPFNLTNGPKTFLNTAPCSPITYNNDPLNGQTNNNKFMAVVGPNTSTLETPIFTLVGLTSASIDWFEAYVLQSGGSIKTEISLDGGVTYNSLLRPTISGATTYGSPTNFKKTSIDLSAYIGLSNLRIRFTYTGTTCSSWGLEMATITKGYAPANYTWNLASPMPVDGTPPGHYLNTFTSSSVIVTPPSPNTTNAPKVYDYSFSSSAGGCVSDITVTVNPVLVTTATTPTQTVCSGTAISPITFNSNLPSTTFSWTRNNTANVTGIAASGTGTVSGTLTNTTNVQQTVTFTINPSAPNSCGAASFTSTVILNPKIPVTLSGGGTICGSQSATLTLTSAGPYPVSVTLSNGVTYSITASPMNILVKPAGTTTYSISSLGNNNCATLSGSGTATVTVISTTGTTGTWLCGAGDGDWFNPCNWANAIVPTLTTDVIIGSAASCNPVINPNSPYAATNGPVAYAKNITISGAKNLSFQNGGQLDVAGNWDNQVGVAGFTANTGTVRFVGSTAQSIKTTGSTETFYNMVVANTSPANAGVTLLSDVRVNNTLTLTKGIVNTKSVPADAAANGLGLLTLGVNAPPVAGSPGATSFINGQLAKEFNTSGVASEYLYPVGKIVDGVPTYKAMAVQPTSVAGTSTFTAEYFPSAHPNPTTVLDLFLLGFVPEYWQVDRTGGTADARIKIPYQNPGSGKWLTTSNAPTADPCATCNVAVVNKANGIWKFTKPSGGFSTTDPETRSYQDNGFIYSGVMSSFGPFTSGYAFNVILPLKLITFTGTVDQDLAKIKWSIEHPEELSEFELQASTDGRSFSQVAMIPPGNGGTAFSYEYAGLRPGSNYFRLLVKGKNGNNFFSKTIMLVSNNHITVIKGIQPTMVKTETFILVNSVSSQMINAKVLDVAGRPVSFYKGSIVQGENKCRVNTLMLLPGVYTIHIETADGVIANLRFVKE